MLVSQTTLKTSKDNNLMSVVLDLKYFTRYDSRNVTSWDIATVEFLIPYDG